MFLRQEQRRAIGVENAGVGKQLHAGGPCCVGDCLVLRHTMADLARRDEQDLVYAVEGCLKALRPGILRLPYLHTSLRTGLRFLRIAHDRDNLFCVYLFE